MGYKMIHLCCPLCGYHEARTALTTLPPCYKCNTKMVMDDEYTLEDPDFEGYPFDLEGGDI